ncbi:MAG: hypothetical protein ACLVJH_15170 [Faecalibacterium prausnitzii]
MPSAISHWVRIAVTGWCSAAVTAVFGWLTAAGASRMKAAKTLELYADTAEGFDWHKGLSSPCWPT